MRGQTRPPVAPLRRISFTAITHRGLRRASNEDTVAIGNWLGGSDMETPLQRVVDLQPGVFCAVADGMGGHEGGALASRFALARLQREAAGLADAAQVSAFLGRLDRDLIQLGADRGARQPPGTTIAALLVRPDGQALAVNVGDSRIYLLDAAGPRRLSVDDTAATQPGPDDRTGTGGHALTQALGGKHAPARLVPHVSGLTLRAGARLLLCSDGLSDVVGLSDIARLAGDNTRDDSGLAAGLFALAMERGGPDNITVCVVRPLG